MYGERNHELAHARLAEECRWLYRRVAGLGERVPACVNESTLPYECERGAADAVTAHRLPHDLVDRGDGGWPCWREPAWPHPVGSPGEEGRKTSP